MARPTKAALAIGLAFFLLAAACTPASDGPAAAVPAETPAPPSTPTAQRPSPAAQDTILTAPQPVRLPADDGPHNVGIEWWYYHAHLQSADGRAYGVMMAVFKRQGEQQRSGYVAHAAITDQRRRAFRLTEEVTISRSAANTNDFDLRVGEVRAAGYDGKDVIAATVKDYSFELRLSSQTPPVLHGKTGFVGVSPSEASYYYSRPRMLVEGFVVDQGERVAVQGTGWMDHQWGDFSLSGGGGWDWFAVQLEDNVQLMVSSVRDARGTVVLEYGTLVQPDGSYQHLEDADIELQSTGAWKSPMTNATYPLEWGLALPHLPLQLTLMPVLKEQEMNTKASVDRVYWEGQTTATGRMGDRQVSGMAYVELTGYDAGATSANTLR